jgi:hypothetical protein
MLSGSSTFLCARDDGSGKIYMGDHLFGQRQCWKLVRTDHKAPKYSFRHAIHGEGLSIDILNDRGTDSGTVYLARTGRFTGQFWTITRWDDGTFRLYNDFTEEDQHLASTAEGELTMAEGDDPSQHWVFTEVVLSV